MGVGGLIVPLPRAAGQGGLGLSHFYVLLADLRLAVDDKRGALEALDAGRQHIENTGERFSEPEVFRFIGRTLMEGPAPDPDGATVAYEKAVSAARDQEAKLLWLRAAIHLTTHQRKIGAPATMLDELASLCEWFGASELPDVVRARGLLAAESPVA
jgi:hypothetical protein